VPTAQPHRTRALAAAALLLLLVWSAAYYRILMGYLAIYPRFPDVEKLAAHLYGEGYSLADLEGHVHGRYASDLFLGLSAFAPIPPRAPSGRTDDIVVLTVPRALASKAPPDWRLVSVRGGHAVLVSTIRPYADFQRANICAAAPEDHDAALCVALNLSPAELRNTDTTAVAALLDAPLRDRFELVFVIPVTTRAGDEAHILQTGIGWRVDRIDGIPFRGALPNRTVVIEGGRAAQGAVHVRLEAWQVRRGTRRRFGVGDLWEVRERDAVLAQPIAFPFIEPD
jgi:hypothetical protein